VEIRWVLVVHIFCRMVGYGIGDDGIDDGTVGLNTHPYSLSSIPGIFNIGSGASHTTSISFRCYVL